MSSCMKETEVERRCRDNREVRIETEASEVRDRRQIQEWK